MPTDLARAAPNVSWNGFPRSPRGFNVTPPRLRVGSGEPRRWSAKERASTLERLKDKGVVDATGIILDAAEVDCLLELATPKDGRVPHFVEAHFGLARFCTDIDFKRAIFDSARFEGARFEGSVDFGESCFGTEPSSIGPKFEGAVFAGQAVFLRARFGPATGFSGAKFGEHANFRGAKFGRVAAFRHAQFGPSAMFDDTTFDAGADFSNAVFDEDADFRRAAFGGEGYFKEVRFGFGADFSSAQLEGVSFEDATLAGCRLNDARFDYRSSLKGTRLFTRHTGALSFVGWNTSADGSGSAYQPGDSFTLRGDVTLYAQWTAKTTATVSFDANGGKTILVVPGEDWTRRTFRYGSAFAAPHGILLSNSGYSFAGWNTSADGSGCGYQPGDSFTLRGDVTLYAQWTAKATATVRFDANGGQGTVGPQTGLEGSPFTAPEGSGLSNPGYSFAGWNTSADGTGSAYRPGDSFTLNGDVTLYAQWTATATVSFDANWGEGTIGPQTGLEGSTFTAPEGSGLSNPGHSDARPPYLGDVQWNGVHVSGVRDWSYKKRPRLGEAPDDPDATSGSTRLLRRERGKTVADESIDAVIRAYRQVSIVLENEGSPDIAWEFDYRASELLHHTRHGWAKVVSYLLGLTTGYGHRFWRVFITYLGVVTLFALIYGLTGATSWADAFPASFLAFHGRGIVSNALRLRGQSGVAIPAVEAAVGLFVEAAVVAVIVRRLFHR